MKKILKLSFAFLAMGIFHSNLATAAFPIKQNAASIEQNATSLSVNVLEPNEVVNQNVELKQQVSAQKVEQKKGSSAEVPQLLYIILAILPLGWLAMGINDDWSGNDWWISLILYILGWLPGFIFTLIKMSNYY